MPHTLIAPPLRTEGEGSRRRLVVVVLIALLGALLVAFQPPLAAYAATGSISGNVKGVSSTNLEGIFVYAQGTNGTVGFGFGMTNSSGNYAMADLEPGQYQVQFDPPFDSDYLGEYYDNVNSPAIPTPVAVTSGATTSGINAVLALGGQITGNVTGAGSGSLEGISVRANGPSFNTYTDFTDAAGDYEIRGLPSGSYTLEFFSENAGNWLREFYNDQPTEAAAQAVVVTAPNVVTGKNAELATGATLSGTVTGEDSPSLGLEGVRVETVSTTTGLASSANTDGDGNYVIEGLAADSYIVWFDAPYLDSHYGEYYNDTLSYDDAEPVAVAALASVTGIDAILGVGATIGGTVTGGAPAVPVVDIPVTLTAPDASFSSVATAWTDGDGNYELVGIPPGQYALSFEAPFDSTTLVGEYWNNSPTLAGATTITTVAGQELTGYDAVLDPAGYIAGNVKGPGNVNLANVSVSAMAVADGVMFEMADTDAGGNYQIGGLRAGQYRVYFSPDYTTDLAGEYWNDTFEYDLATFVTVAPAGVVTNINAALSLAGTMSGNVKGPGNINLAGATVSFSRNGCACGDGVVTDVNGNWSVTGLTPGNYILQFYGPDGTSYIPEYFNDSLTLAGATPVVVSSGGSVTGRNAVLAVGGTISGTVRNAANVPLEGIDVIAIDPTTGEDVAYGYTQEDGTYSVAGLQTGSYKLEFYDYFEDYATEYWNDQISLAAADSIAVTAGSTVAGRDATLALESSISGVVTDAKTGAAIPYAAVAAYTASAGTANSSSLVATGYANSHGAYTISGLPIGSYRLGFTDQSSGTAADGSLLPSDPHVSEWSGNVYTFGAAISIAVTMSGQAVTGQNAALENPTFADVLDPTSSFYPYIEWMSATGISTGTPNPPGKPLYKPVNAVSRQAMANFLYKLDGDTFTPPAEQTFADVDSSNPFYTAIEWMAAEGISTGTPQPSGKPLFKPADPVSRQSMAVFLARYEGIDTSTPPAEQSFADVPTTASTAAAIGWMKTSGISTGTSQPSGLPLYKPLDPVSRQAMAAFLYRLASLPT